MRQVVSALLAWFLLALLVSRSEKGEATREARGAQQCAANWCTNFNCSLGLGIGVRLTTYRHRFARAAAVAPPA